MIFCHAFADFNLQTTLMANLKQRRWWEENYPNPSCRHDYVAVLVLHSFVWTFMIMLPLAVFAFESFEADGLFLLVFGLNVIAHSLIDHLKANMLKINLITDQLLHLFQISITFFVLEMA
jgi:hypothetical protein